MTYFTSSIGQAYGRIVSGKITVTNAGTAVQVSGTSTPIGGVWVSGDVNGSGSALVVGDVNVCAINGSQAGAVVLPGNASIFLPINNLNLLYVDSELSGGQLCYAYLQPADLL